MIFAYLLLNVFAMTLSYLLLINAPYNFVYFSDTIILEDVGSHLRSQNH